MNSQKIYFKEHSRLDLFETKDEGDLTANTYLKTKLVSTSNRYGYSAVAYKNVIKIVCTSTLESNNNIVQPLASFMIDENLFEVVHVELNCDQTHLFVLAANLKNGLQKIEYILYIYALETLSFDLNAPKVQTPVCMNKINLEQDCQPIVDLCASPSESSLIAVCKQNGVIQLIGNLFDKNHTITSKDLDSACICWSPKGKQLASYCRNNKLILLDHNLNVKNTFECLKNGFNPINISWFSKKQFFISSVEQIEPFNPHVHYVEIVTDKNTQTNSVREHAFDNLTYSLEVPFRPSINLINLDNWNLIICANSKTPDVFQLQKGPNDETYQILEIEDFKCSLPLSKNDEEVFPTGIAVNFNCTKQINFDKFDTQPACPILLMMTNKGTLVTFFVINLESTNKSICYPPEKLQLKNIQPVKPIQAPQIGNLPRPTPVQQQQQQQPNLTVNFNQNLKQSSSGFTFGNQPIQPNQFKPSVSSPLNISGAGSTPSSVSFNFKGPSESQNSLQSVDKQQPTPSAGILTRPTGQQQTQTPNQGLFQPTVTFPQFALNQPPPNLKFDTQNVPAPFKLADNVQQKQHSTQQSQQQPQLQLQPSQSQQSFQQMPQQIVQPVPQQQQVQQKTAQVQMRPEIQKISQKQSVIGELTINDRMHEISSVIKDLKAKTAKLYDGNDIKSNLIDYKLFKTLKTIQDVYSILSRDMQSINDKSDELRSNILNDFHNFEMLRLRKYNLENPKMINSIKNADIDPITKEKFENVKKMFAYVNREFPNLKTFLDAQKKKKQEHTDHVAYDLVYENIKAVDIFLNNNNKQIDKLINHIKFLKLDNCNLIRNMNQLRMKQKFNESSHNGKEQDKITIEEINKRVSKIDLMDEADTNENEEDSKSKEKDAVFYTQLYELLRKRKQIPTQEVSLQQLDIFDAKYELSEPGVQIPIADTSFLKLQSPKIVQQPEAKMVLQPQQQPQKLLVLPQPTIQQSKPQMQSSDVFSVNQAPSIGQQIKLPISSLLNTQLPTELTNNLIAENIPNMTVTPQKNSLTMSGFVQQQTSPQKQPLIFNIQSQTQQPQIPAPTLQQQQTTLTITKPQQPTLAQPKPAQPAPISQQPAPPVTQQPAAPIQTSTPNLFNALSANLNNQQPSGQFSFNLSDKKPPLFNNFVSNNQPPVNLNTNIQKGLFGQSTITLSNAASQNDTPQSSQINIVQNPQTNQSDQQQSAPKQTQPNLFSLNLTSGPKFSFNLGSSSKPDESTGAKTIPTPLANVKPPNSAPEVKPLTVENQSKSEQAQQQQQKSADKTEDQSVVKEPSPAAKTDSATTTTTNTGLFETKIGESKFSFGETNLSGNSSFSMLANKTSNIFGQKLPNTETNNSQQTPTVSGNQTSSTQPPNVVEKKTSETPTISKPENEEKKSTEETFEKQHEKSEPTKIPDPNVTTQDSKVTVPAAEKAEEKIPNGASIKANQMPSTTTTNTAEQQTTTAQPASQPQSQPPAPTSFLGQSAQTAAKPLTANIFGSSQQGGSLFSNLKPSGSLSQSGNAQSSVAFSLSQPSTAPNVNPFTAMTNQAPKAQTTNELDADMDSSTNSMASHLASGLGFGGLGGPKTTTEPTKNVFGANLFGATATQPQQPKPVFGILKTPTFTAGQVTSTGPSSSNIFGSPTALGANSNPSNQPNSGGGLFSSFKTPEKPVFGGAPAFGGTSAAFGGAAAFGTAPAFGGGSSFGAGGGTSLFGSSSTVPSQSTFGSAPLFGASSTSNQPSGFSALAANGTGFGTFGQNTSAPTVGFGTLAQQQQQPQQSLFSTFGQNNQQTGFTSPNSSSFTAYRK